MIPTSPDAREQYMKKSNQTSIPEHSDAPLVEVLDQRGRMVAVVAATEARRQLLPHRSVVVLLADDEDRVFLYRRPAGHSAERRLWDASARGPVLAGEALMAAATRILEQATGLHVERMRPAFEQAPCVENGNVHLHVFQCSRPSGGHEPLEHGQFFTLDEARFLMREFRELVSPRLALLAEASGLFRRPGLRG